MTTAFKLCTCAHFPPLEAELRERILAKPLSPAEAALFHCPIEQWKTVDRTTFEAFSCSVSCAKEPADIPRVDVRHPILSKIGVYAGPVTNLAVEAIVNAANRVCLGGGGVDGAIHKGAGPLLKRECATYGGCAVGQAVITKAYNLPARYVIHTVGPFGEHPVELRSCYQSILALAAANELRSIGLCGVSTGVYGYPLKPATRIAVNEVATFLKRNPDTFDFVAFACFLDDEVEAYEEAMRWCSLAGDSEIVN